MSPNATVNGWSLEVVRGRDVGRAYALDGAAVVLGNDTGLDPAGIDLADQEGNAPRRMAARQARIDGSPGGLTLHDLDSPGGTFVNRRRVLAGQEVKLGEGDVIQLGGVQLKVVRAKPAAPAPSPRPTPAPQPVSPRPLHFPLQAGLVCRSWDDFLTVSAQRWEALRDELTSGRLAAYLIGAGHATLAPSAQAPGSPDERLDAWLGSLPTSKPAAPELDLHPAVLSVRAAPGGGVTRRQVHVANAGYRLLRGTARVEPAGTAWLAVSPKPFTAAEAIDLPVEVTIPETFAGPLSATVVVETNGGTGRVTVRLEPPAAADAIPEAAAPAPPADWRLAERLSAVPARTRWIAAIAGVAGLRLAVGLLGGALGWSSVLAPAALVLGLAGGLAGAALARRRGGWPDVPPGGFAGAFAGVLAAEVYTALCQTVEPLLPGRLAGSVFVAAALWALLGAAAAWLSNRLAPPRTREEAP